MRKQMNYDEMWHYKSVSLYADSVQAYMKAFSAAKVLIFEEFVQDKEGHVREVFDFLGASPFEQYETAMAYSKSGAGKSQIVTALFGRSSSLGSTMRKLAFSLLGRTNVEKKLGKHLMTENEGMSLETRKMLNGYFAEDIAKLETVLNRDFYNYGKYEEGSALRLRPDGHHTFCNPQWPGQGFAFYGD